MATPQETFNILHVDDNQSVLEFVKQFIAGQDPSLQFTTTDSPLAALKILQTATFDCILLDYKMPEMNGIELAQKIRSLYATPIILYTGQGSEEVAEQAYAAGVDDYIRKEEHPAHYQVLAKRIRHVVEKHRLDDLYRTRAGDITNRLNYERKLEALHSNSIAITLAANLDEICDVTLNTIESVLGFQLLAFMIPRVGGLIAIGNRKSPGLGRPLPLDGKGITVRAFREQRTIRVNDTRLDLDFVKGTSDSLSELVVPIILDGETVAVINLESTELGAFTREDQNLVEIIAGHIASAMKQIRFLDRERRNIDKLEALHIHAVHLSDLNNLEEIAPFTLEIVSDVLGHSRGGFAIVDGDKLLFKHLRGVNLDNVPEMRLDGKGITVRAVKTREAQLVNDTHLDPDYVSDKDGVNLSELDVPIKVDGNVMGVINLESKAPEAYTEEDRHIVEILSEHVALAIKRIHLLDNERRNTARLEALNRSAVNLSKSKSIEEAIDAACKILNYDFGYQWVGIGRVDKDAIRYVKYIGATLSGNDIIPLTQRTVTVRAVETGDIQLVRDSTKDPDYVILSPVEKPYLSELVVPVRMSGKIEYVINVESLNLDAFSDEDQHHIELLSLQLGSAFELIRDREKLAALHKHAPLIVLAKDVSEIAQLTLNTTNEVFNFPIASFHVVKGDLVELICVSGFTINGTFSQSIEGPGLIPLAIREGRSLLIDDLRINEHYVRGPIGTDVRLSELVVPVKIGGRCVAAINLEDTRAGAFTEEDRKMVELLALHVGTALELIEEKKQVQEQQNIETREILEGANRISSMVRHDLRGPLQTIKNATFLAEQQPDKAKDMLNAIDESVEYATKILDDLRNSTAPIQLVKTVVNVNDLIELSLAAASIPTDITVKKQYGEEHITASLDPTRIRRALDNLIKNAVEAMPSRGDLTVSLTRSDEIIEIDITDTGVGIPKEIMDNLFRPFYTTKPRGTGLGLAVCRQAVEAHGGTITVTSEPGKGSTFTIRIPRRAEPTPATSTTRI